MKMLAIIQRLVVSWLVIWFSCGIAHAEANFGNVTVEKPAEMLATVNARLKKMHHTEFTMDGLAVWLAVQANIMGYDPVAESIVQSVMKKTKFEHPVDVEWFESSISWKDANDAKHKFELPRFETLGIRIYSRPLDKIAGAKAHINYTWLPIATEVKGNK